MPDDPKTPATKQVSPIVQKRNNVKALLEHAKDQFAQALPTHVSPDKLLRVAMTQVSNTPKLLECGSTSLLSSIMTCAQLGLLPDGVLGQAYLIPFDTGYGPKKRTQCQVVVGYKGLLTLARNSGEISSITAQVVHEQDFFEYEFGLEEKCRHVPAQTGEPGEITHVYAIARFKDGGHYFDVMTREAVDNIMKASQGYKAAEKEWGGKPAKKNSPWHLHYTEMARKTAIRRIAKYLPMSVQKAVSLDEARERGEAATIDASGAVIIETPPPAIEDNTEAHEPTDLNTLQDFAEEQQGHDAETGEVIDNWTPWRGAEPLKDAVLFTTYDKQMEAADMAGSVHALKVTFATQEKVILKLPEEEQLQLRNFYNKRKREFEAE